MLELNKCYNDDCLDGLKELEDNSVDLVTTDPPYAISFMSKTWDKSLVSVEVWRECLRVLKPGAFAFIMSAPRQDVLSRMIVNIEDAGFKTDFSSIYWTYFSGFPKSLNISKAIEKKFGEDIPKAKEFSGAYTFNPKPAVELVLVAQKPLSEKTYVDQVLANGKGGVWFDDCRIPYKSEKDKESSRFGIQTDITSGGYGSKRPSDGNIMATNVLSSETGRFPANLLVCDDILNDGVVRKGGGSIVSPPSARYSGLTYNGGKESEGGDRDPFGGYNDEGSASRYFDLDAWWEERIKSMDPAVLGTFPFLLVPKASVGEKNAGLDDVEAQYMDGSRKVGSPGGTNPRNRGAQSPRKNFHPTVKPVKLFTYLITLGSRKGDVVLDPFGGSGTTGVAAEISERDYILFEMEQDFHELACKRIEFQQAITKKKNATPLSDIFKMKC